MRCNAEQEPHTIRPSTPGRGAPHFPIAHVHAVCTAILLTALLLRTHLIDGSVATTHLAESSVATYPFGR